MGGAVYVCQRTTSLTLEAVDDGAGVPSEVDGAEVSGVWVQLTADCPVEVTGSADGLLSGNLGAYLVRCGAVCSDGLG